MDDISLDRLLSGDLSKLPELPKRVVRLFISSTFTDMTLERNSLMERVYPRLKKYCRERHGLDFQVVDMRWGVRDEATDDHQTVDLCSREIENCQRVSLGPNFIALIGDKYGFRPLLNRIKSTEYRSLRRCLIESDINTDFLDTWYKEDLNAVPPEYVLQPISSILKNFTNKNEPELQMVDQRIWQAIQDRLHDLLLIGSGRLVKQNRMSERERSLKYSISVTEREVLEGCLDLNETKAHCLVYVRTIVDLRSQLSSYFEELGRLGEHHQQLELATTDSENSSSSRRDSIQRKASLKIGDDSITLNTSGPQTVAERKLERQRRLMAKYIDLTSKEGGAWQVDEDAQQALNELKENKLRSKLSSSGRNLTIYQVHWNNQDGISAKSDEHKRYLDDMTEHFYQNLTRMIRSAVKSERSKVETKGLVGEVLQHSHYSLQVGKRLLRRSRELDQVRSYILTGSCRPVGTQHGQEGGRSDAVQPMFLYGVSGSGKTSVLARAATMAHEWVRQSSGKHRVSSVSTAQNVSELAPSKQRQPTRDRWDRAPCIIMRFCCTTPASSSVVGMLTSVCRQLQYNFYQFGPLNGLMDEQTLAGKANHATNQKLSVELGRQTVFDQLPFQQIPEDFVRLVYTFRQLLENCRHPLHKRRIFVIIIDSIERLSSPAECSVEAKFSWLTNLVKLPPNVRLIVSCGSSGASRSELADYLHLKRHFLQLHLPRQSEEWRLSGRASSGSSDDASESITSNDFDGSPSNERANSRFRLVKLLIIPATRIALATGGFSFNSEGDNLEGLARRSSVFSFPRRASIAPLSSSSPQEQQRKSSSDSVQSIAKTSSKPPSSVSSCGLMHIRPLGRELGQKVLRRWLTESGRNLSSQQWAIVDRSLGHCSRPIFVKLAFGEVVNWKSYSMRGDTRGLTFGSAWLGDFRLDAGNSLLHQLVRRHESETRSAEDELKFKWQMLAMEQQWLNYLDYTSSKTSDQRLNDAKDETSDLVIRVGAAGASRNGTSAASESAKAALASSSAFASAGSASICHLSDTIEDAICQLFARIELKHGYLLTRHSLSYITTARNGICENELEDILSLDDVVLDDVFQYHLPPVRRIPPLLWTRIRNDLADYLSERDADGIVLTWHHGQFKDVTQRRYLTSDRQLVYVHSLMADYFLGKWADQAKPFRCTKQQVQMAAEQLESAIQQSMRRDSAEQSISFHHQGRRQSSLTGGGRFSGRLGSGSAAAPRSGISFSLRNRLRASDQSDQRMQWMNAKAHRRVPHQPLYYETSADQKSGSATPNVVESARPEVTVTDENLDMKRQSERPTQRRRYNLRKLTELPFHLLRSGRFLELANHVLFNYRWLFAAIDALGLQSLFVDLNEAANELERELTARRALPSQPEGDDPTKESEVGDFGADEYDVLSVRDTLSGAALKSLAGQLATLISTLRLSASVVHSDHRQLAPQLLGRLLSAAPEESDERESARERSPDSEAANKLAFLEELLEQCDRDGCSDCALLPVGHCLQSADGLQLSSLEGHPFGVLSMCLASDQRHLLAVSNKFIMWNISTGEVARDIDPQLNGAIIKHLLLGASNKIALAYTSENQLLSLEISTQRVVQFDLGDLRRAPPSGQSSEGEKSDEIAGMKLIDEKEAKRFFVWLRSGRVVVLKLVEEGPGNERQQHLDQVSFSMFVQYELSSSLRGEEAHERVLDVAVEQAGPNADLVLVATSCSVGPMRLNSSKVVFGADENIEDIQIWPRCEAELLVLGPSLRQLIAVDASGDIELSRRRAAGWSSGKLLCRQGLETGAIANVLAVELEAGSQTLNAGLDEEGCLEDDLDGDHRRQLAAFERELDGDCAEIEPLHCAFEETHLASQQDSDPRRASAFRRRAKFAKLYYTDQIHVLLLDRPTTGGPSSDYERLRLTLPRDMRNVSLDANRSQLATRIVPKDEVGSGASRAEHYLIVVDTRQVLVYALEGQQLLKCFEAHANRITALLPIQARVTLDPEAVHNDAALQGRHGSASSSALVTSSMDRTVKIWNLANLQNESRPVSRLSSTSGGRKFDSIRLHNQRPLACCLSQGQLSLWDWQVPKMLASFDSFEELTRRTSSEISETGKEADSEKCSKMSHCKFSKNGRYLTLASTGSSGEALVSLLAVEGSAQQPDGSRRGANSANSSKVHLRLWSSRVLHGQDQVLKLKFFAQDSRLLVVARLAKPDLAPETNTRRDSLATGSSSEAHKGDADKSAPHQDDSTEFDHLRISVLTVPEVRHLHSFECSVPKHLAGSRKSRERLLRGSAPKSVQRPSRVESPGKGSMVALTCDQQYLVVVGVKSVGGSLKSSSGQAMNQTDPAPELGQSTILNIYTTRDGQLSKTVDLSQLQIAAVSKQEDFDLEKANEPSKLPNGSSSLPSSKQNLARFSVLDERFANIRLDQFDRLKAVANRDRQSIVALMDDERGTSWLVDVASRALLAQTSSWAGKTSADGRYGLSRMFASAGTSDGQADSKLSAGGLRLLDMPHCRPVRSLLALDQFDALMSRGSVTTSDSSGGTKTMRSTVTGQSELIYGFAKPADAHVFICEPRRRQLVLVRARDGKLLANLRLPAEPSCIKSAPDGLALIVGLNDGALISLAIVEPFAGDALSRLAQYPSRRARKGAISKGHIGFK